MKWVVVTSLFFGSAFLMGCSGRLSRSEAGEIIRRHYQAGDWYGPEVVTHIGKISGYCSESARQSGTAAGSDEMADSVDGYALLQRIGAVTVEKIGEPFVYDFQLTELGRQAAGEPYAEDKFESTCVRWQVNLAVARWDRVEVTGIAQEGVSAEVEAYLCRKPTAFGEKFLGLPEKEREFLLENGFDLGYRQPDGDYCIQEEVAFRKYDDGWRIK